MDWVRLPRRNRSLILTGFSARNCRSSSTVFLESWDSGRPNKIRLDSLSSVLIGLPERFNLRGETEVGFGEVGIKEERYRYLCQNHEQNWLDDHQQHYYHRRQPERESKVLTIYSQDYAQRELRDLEFNCTCSATGSREMGGSLYKSLASQ